MNWMALDRKRASDAAAAQIVWPEVRFSRQPSGPVTFGVALQKGRVRQAARTWLVGPEGERLATQTEVLNRWADGTIRWLLVDALFPESVDWSAAWQVEVEQGDDGAAAIQLMAGSAVEDLGGGSLRIVTRDLNVQFDDGGAWHATIGESQAGTATARAELPRLTDARGRIHVPVVLEIRTTADGPVRTTVDVRAVYPAVRGLNLCVRWNFYKESSLVTADVTVHNFLAARHAGGVWDLGDEGSILFKDLTLSAALMGAGKRDVSVRLADGEPWRTAPDGHFELLQESSGGENWNSKNHLNRYNVVPLRYRGYRGQVGQEAVAGNRAQPRIRILAERAVLEAEIEDFWQQFPKGMSCNQGEVQLRLFPGQFGDLHELQGGEQKTHRVTFFVRLSDSPSAAKVNGGDRDAKCAVRMLPRIGRLEMPGLPQWEGADEAALERLDQLAEEYLSGKRGLFADRERVDEYGWRNYGDLHASHEELYYSGEQPLISHYNNQFDLVAGCLLQYMRTGDVRWWDVADPLARHVIDIDIYHTKLDRPAYSGGLFWFTDHYLHAYTSSHRTYSRHNAPQGGAYGGGPSCEHNFTTGLALYYLLTGNTLAKEAVRSLAEWVLAMDDGRRTFLGVFDDGPTGLASRPQSPGRGAGNSINALLDGWMILGERKFLDYAETIVRRCIHPADPLPEMDLLHAEKNWSYTVFLVSLSKYLDCKAEAGQYDAMWEYARQSLVHYGVWMAENERPYLDQREQLEYPTEAWPAQDFRKANALRLAARYAGAEAAERMRKRGNELANRAWSDLEQFETRTTARAMAVMLVEGLRDAALRTEEGMREFPKLTNQWLEPRTQFQTQRERVKQRLKSLRGVGSLAMAVAKPSRWPRLLSPR